jgi:hypothetical protein
LCKFIHPPLTSSLFCFLSQHSIQWSILRLF